MFLLIFRFTGESSWSYREVNSFSEKERLLSSYARITGKDIEESQFLGADSEICAFLGIDAEITKVRHENVVWV